MKKIVIATKNPGKAREFTALFSEYGYEVETLLDHPDFPDIVESGQTFLENATIKATEGAKALHELVLADDSGLEIPSLNGEPGVFSARYSGQDHNDRANRKKVLEKMKDVPDDQRQGIFHTVLVLSNAKGEVLKHYSGELRGEITREEHGESGFGYDPIFYVPNLDLTLAELSVEEKNKISHRGKAVKKLEEDLKKGGLEEL